MAWLNLLTTVPALPFRSQIVFPSAPTLPEAPVLSSLPSGSLAATTYYVKVSWIIQTQDGSQYESEPSEESSITVDADYVLVVVSPVPPPMPYAVIGWNAYVSITPGEETLQAANIQISSTWIAPATALIAGTLPQPGWGNAIVFTYPGREFPYFNPNWHGHDDFSTAGWQQSITWYVDKLTDFEVPYIESGTDALAWKQFLTSAIQRVPFDFYEDSTLGTHTTLLMMSTNPKMEYRYPGIYQLKLKCREVILTT